MYVLVGIHATNHVYEHETAMQPMHQFIQNLNAPTIFHEHSKHAQHYLRYQIIYYSIVFAKLLYIQIYNIVNELARSSKC